MSTIGVSTSGRRPEPEIVVFCDPSKRKKTPQDGIESTRKRSVREPGMTPLPSTSLEEARREVFRLGLSGFEKSKKEEAKIALAIKLGAKPPKNKYYNYKDYMEKKRIEKQEQKALRAKNRALGLKVRKPLTTSKPKRKAGSGAVRGFTYQVGRYEDGVQKISNGIIKAVSRRKR